MNSIIEAQDEYFQWVVVNRSVAEPSMPMFQMELAVNSRVIPLLPFGEIWDAKLANEQDPDFVCEAAGYRFVYVLGWPTYSLSAETPLIRIKAPCRPWPKFDL